MSKYALLPPRSPNGASRDSVQSPAFARRNLQLTLSVICKGPQFIESQGGTKTTFELPRWVLFLEPNLPHILPQFLRVVLIVLAYGQ
jgi:hypothetical protein